MKNIIVAVSNECILDKVGRRRSSAEGGERRRMKEQTERYVRYGKG